MPTATLLICLSCHGSDQRPPGQAADGTALCERIQSLQQTGHHPHHLEVRGVNCLWTCGHPCSMALTAEAKPTYALANVAVEDDSFGSVAQAALQLSELYLNSKSGTIPWNQFPDILKTDIVARIPSSTGNSRDEED